jgi:hypothetical protein
MRLRPNGGQATAKPRQQARLFDLISIKLKYLHTMFAYLSGLRQCCDEPRAKWRHRSLRLTAHAAASGFLRGGAMASDRSVVLTHVMKLRKIFRREAALRQCFIGHARKLHNVPEMAAVALTL